MSENEVFTIIITDLIQVAGKVQVVIDVRVRTEKRWVYFDSIAWNLELGSRLAIRDNQASDTGATFAIERGKDE